MADIIEFGKKAEGLKSERETILRQRKIEALKKLFQCTRCMLRCSKCGSQIDTEPDECAKFATPYSFCRSCREEYEEYRDRIGGNRTGTDCYWHNTVWMKTWETWLHHQKAMDRYRQSKEFLQLLDEVEDLLRK
jgi:hypothetical protein